VGTKEKPKDGVENMFVTRNRLTDLTTNTILLGSFLTGIAREANISSIQHRDNFAVANDPMTVWLC
jgi:hypothetical protein